MFHIFTGTVQRHATYTFFVNDLVGIQVNYSGEKDAGTFFLHPYLDDVNKTIVYFAFDSLEEKKLRTQIAKVNGIGAKTAYTIATLGIATIKQAVDTFDTKVLTNLPGIGPKTAKRLLVELKSVVTQDDLTKGNIEEKYIQKICTTLTTLGYKKQQIIKKLKDYPAKISQEKTEEVIVWLVKNL